MPRSFATKSVTGIVVAGRVGIAVVSLAILLSPSFVLAGDVPLWQRLLRWSSGKSDSTSVPVMMMGLHMQMSEKAVPKPGDVERADVMIDAARQVLHRYQDVKAAEKDGYRPFHTTGEIGEEIHYSSVRWGYAERKRLYLDHPGSILYRRTQTGLEAVGVMYSAPNSVSAEDLDGRAPLSIAVWHRHVHFCGAPKGTPESDMAGPVARFGYSGSLHTEDGCKAADGYWIPVAFGWMTHIYPNEIDTERIWGGEDMNMSQAAPHAEEVTPLL